METRQVKLILTTNNGVDMTKVIEQIEMLIGNEDLGLFTMQEAVEVFAPIPCPYCGKVEEIDDHLLLVDHDALYTQPDQNFFDNEITGKAKCKCCENILPVVGTIDWRRQR